MTTRDDSEVLAANEAFYATFARRDATAMDRLWARKSGVTCIHPGWAPIQSRTGVIKSFRRILESPSAPKIACVEPRAHLLGDTAYVLCFEVFAGSRLAATNIFVREDGAWRLVHHQAGPVARQAEEDEEPTDPGVLN